MLYVFFRSFLATPTSSLSCIQPCAFRHNQPFGLCRACFVLDDAARAELLAGYASQRPLSAAEQAAWPAMRRAAALRFWLLRLEARHRPRAGEVVTIKDPDHFRRMLARFRLAPASPDR